MTQKDGCPPRQILFRNECIKSHIFIKKINKSLHDLDASAHSIKNLGKDLPSYKHGYRYTLSFYLFNSMGERGLILEHQLYKKIPTLNIVRRDLIEELKDMKKEYEDREHYSLTFYEEKQLEKLKKIAKKNGW